FSLIRSKKYVEAREVASSLSKDFPKSSLVPQSLYWAARSAELAVGTPDAGPAVDLVAEYRAVLNGFPGTFYGLLASERLAGLGVEAALPFTTEPKELKVKRPPGLELAALLARTGLYRDVAAEVTRALAAMPAADALTWGHALQGLGDFGAAHTLAARHLWGAVYTQRTPEALALMYPRAFRNSVESWASQHELEPALAWAIMRRESAFAPEVTSVADARGLMQLIPPTASNVCANLKLPPADAAELYSPDWNIRLGTWYLKALMKRLQHPTLVAAAYNGGPDAVAKWAKERGSEPLDQWVEEIPYKETRGYVKQVTADLFIYRQLYKFEQKRLSLVIPPPSDQGVNF
ncbi:MAG: lytic transglycosylase domain-containing protein, partial [Archangium sp.]|nr:lytic transglycosylase domain-containing protein [Archangium sp.]